MKNISRREFGRRASAGAAALMLTACRRVPQHAAASAEFDITPYVDPELRPLIPGLTLMGRMMGGGGPMPDVLQMPRALLTMAQLAGSATGRSRPLNKPAWHERMVPGAKGAPDVRIYIINAAKDGAPRPAILHMHGGGFTAQNARGSVRPLQEIALALNCVVVTVDYRLAPGTQFPGALEDNYAALTWLYRNAARLGADKTRIAVMGESAGGGHAAMLAIAARDRGEVPVFYQALTYPMLDDRTGSTRMVAPPKGVLIWTEEQNRKGWTALLGVPAGSAQVPAGAVPARVENLKGLPPTFIQVGSIDLFVDEDREYARRLAELGIPVEIDVVPGVFHGFDIIAPDTKAAMRFRAELTGALERAFATSA